MKRTFRLINDLEQVFDLMDTKHFFNKPNGLGQSMNTEYEINNGYVSLTSNEENAMNISGEMLFAVAYGEPYKHYNELIYFLNTSNVVWLEYSLGGVNSVRAKINKKVDIEKSEIIGGALRCSVTFLRLEHWKSIVKQVVPIKLNIEGGKQYPYKYPYKYSGSGFSQAEIINQSSNAIPIKVFFNPPYSNPTINIVSVSSGKQVSKWQWLGDVNDGQQLILNGIGDYTEQYVKFINAQGESNVYEDLNFDSGFSSYVYVPPGNHMIQIQSDTATFGDIIVEYYNEWNTL